jgi:hypothetical protein
MQLRAFLVLSVMFLVGCQLNPVAPVVNAQQGNESKKLVDDLKAQVETLKLKIVEKDKLLAGVAGSAYGIDIGVKHIEEAGKGRDLVVAENGLIKGAVGDPTPEQRAAAAERSVSILEGDLAKQKDLYGKAQSTIIETKKTIDVKDKEILKRDTALVEQEKKATDERLASAKKLQTTIDDYSSQIQKIKDEQKAKERRLWVNTLRYGGFGIILFGVVALAVTSGRALLPSLILIGSGSLVILIGVGIDVLTSQPWFPYAAGVVGLLCVAGLGLLGYHVYRTTVLGKKSIAVLDDIKTEAATLAEHGDVEGAKLLEKVQPHIDFRFGEDKTFWKNALDTTLIKEGHEEKVSKP